MVLNFILCRKRRANRGTNLVTTPDEEPHVKPKAELEADDRVFEAPAQSRDHEMPIATNRCEEIYGRTELRGEEHSKELRAEEHCKELE